MRPTTLDDSSRHDAQCWNPLPYYRPPALAPALPPAVSHTPDEACCQLILRSILQLHHPSPSTLGFPHAHHAIPAQEGPIQPQRANLRPGPVCRSGLWSIGLSPILCCAAPSSPSSGRLSASVSVPTRDVSRPQVSVPCPEPDSGLRAARTTRYDRRRIHQREHRTAPHRTRTASQLLPDGHNGQPFALTPPARRPFPVPSAIPIPTPCLTRQHSAFCAHLITWELHISSPSRCLARGIWHLPSDAHRHPRHLSQCSFDDRWELRRRRRFQHAGQRPCRQHQPLPVCRLPEEILSPRAPPATHSHSHAGEALYL